MKYKRRFKGTGSFDFSIPYFCNIADNVLKKDFLGPNKQCRKGHSSFYRDFSVSFNRPCSLS